MALSCTIRPTPARAMYMGPQFVQIGAQGGKDMTKRTLARNVHGAPLRPNHGVTSPGADLGEGPTLAEIGSNLADVSDHNWPKSGRTQLQIGRTRPKFGRSHTDQTWPQRPGNCADDVVDNIVGAVCFKRRRQFKRTRRRGRRTTSRAPPDRQAHSRRRAPRERQEPIHPMSSGGAP